LRVLVLVGVLVAANVVFHCEVYLVGHGEYGPRIGIASVIMLISLVGGRIVPSFTRNWLARREPGRLPRAFSRFDMASIAASLLALALWTALPRASLPGSRCSPPARSRPSGSRAGQATARRSARACPPCRLRVRADRLRAAGLVGARIAAAVSKAADLGAAERCHRARCRFNHGASFRPR
jgi:NnrS protein